MGGEKDVSPGTPPPLPGSPPHGRGKIGAILNAGLADRITPAWAGKRSVELLLSVLSLDHPRVGGEKGWDAAPCVLHCGSPPHGRGKAKRPTGLLFPAGITPAWAGKRSGYAVCAWSLQDHPRVGGEKPEWAPITFLMLGSPPRGRGKGWNPCWRGLLNRITPAWAGKRENKQQDRTITWDHPRVGGEKLGRMAVAISVIGSPPRGRGKVAKPDERTERKGITPAWAGKSCFQFFGFGFFWDHPRVGGEKRSASHLLV